MKNRLKLFGIVMALVLSFSFTSCTDTTAGSFYIKNTFDEEITVSINYLGNNDDHRYTDNSGTRVYTNETIPANTIKEFDVGIGDYRISFFVTSSPNISGTKYASVELSGYCTLVIF